MPELLPPGGSTAGKKIASAALTAASVSDPAHPQRFLRLEVVR
jgi:hypothetical protein